MAYQNLFFVSTPTIAFLLDLFLNKNKKEL